LRENKTAVARTQLRNDSRADKLVVRINADIASPNKHQHPAITGEQVAEIFDVVGDSGVLDAPVGPPCANAPVVQEFLARVGDQQIASIAATRADEERVGTKRRKF
jgi:hypothetical protein